MEFAVAGKSPATPARRFRRTGLLSPRHNRYGSADIPRGEAPGAPLRRDRGWGARTVRAFPAVRLLIAISLLCQASHDTLKERSDSNVITESLLNNPVHALTDCHAPIVIMQILIGQRVQFRTRAEA